MRNHVVVNGEKYPVGNSWLLAAIADLQERLGVGEEKVVRPTRIFFSCQEDLKRFEESGGYKAFFGEAPKRMGVGEEKPKPSNLAEWVLTHYDGDKPEPSIPVSKVKLLVDTCLGYNNPTPKLIVGLCDLIKDAEKEAAK